MPGSSMMDLFGGTDLEGHLDDKRKQLRSRVSRCPSQDLMGDALTELIEYYVITPATLRREQATLSPTESGSTVSVTLQIPYVGDSDVFRHKPRDLRTARRWYGRLVENDPDGSFSITDEFPAGTSASDIRAWAKALVDELEAVLAEARRILDAHNREIVHDAEQRASERRTVLGDVATLSDELKEPGI